MRNAAAVSPAVMLGRRVELKVNSVGWYALDHLFGTLSALTMG